MNLTEYFKSKKIDSENFKLKESKLWIELEKEFENTHPNSFTAQKLYLINAWRRKYPLAKKS